MVKSKGRRGGVKSMLVEPYLQVKLGLMFIIVNIIFSILIFGVLTWYVWDVFGALRSYFELTGQDAGVAMDKLQFPLLFIGMLVLAFVGTTIYVAVQYTHQIYGPLVSINRFLDDALEGRQPGRLALRESDQLHELATKLNLLLEMKR